MNNSLNIRNIPEYERPKEKLLTYGAETLNNSELLAIILGSGVKGENAIELSNRILNEFDDLDGILTEYYNEIISINWIKSGKASQIMDLI